MKPDTENNPQNPPRSSIICKGKKTGTTLPCAEILCETDGENLFVQMPSGKELTIKPGKKRGFGLICSECDFKTFWTYGMRGEQGKY